MRRLFSIGILLVVPVVSIAQVETNLPAAPQRDMHRELVQSECTAVGPQLAVQPWYDARSSIKQLWRRNLITTSCSGNNCGCEVAQQECMEGCPQYPEPGWLECSGDCRRDYKRCAIACCDPNVY
jgi:hypothetical protein